ncbi:hypothetical protein [Streptomyces sp. NPDC088141]|uniref:hypothetical protein n=1 Tax=unclassified Streptomyces TaxID=2593676 RepID=UPI0034210F18
MRRDTPYGDHLGVATGADRVAGRQLSPSVQFASGTGRVNAYDLEPNSTTAGTPLWDFTEPELDVFRAQIRQRSLRIVSEWEHNDGIAFIVVSSKV